MTKEELEKEACEGYIKRIRQVGVKDNYRNQTYNDGYLDGAEPREKRIAELEAQIEKMKSALIDIKSNTDDVNIEWQIKYLFDELEIKEND